MDTAASLDERDHQAAEALLLRLADDEFVLGERYIEWQIFAPTLESDLALANIAQDEFGHARLWYDLLQEEFGYTEPELIFERDPADFRHATLVELPFASGDWADAIVRGYLYDMAERLRLDAIEHSSYSRLADPVEKILTEERYHREHSQSWLERLCEDERSHERVQRAVDRLFPHALTLFEPSPYEDAIVESGLRSETVTDMRAQWLDIVVPFLGSLGITVPLDPEAPPDECLPAQRGRDGDHTRHWSELHDELTRTWRELGRTHVRRLRGETRG